MKTEEQFAHAYNMDVLEREEAGILPKNEMSYDFVRDNLKNLEGQMLTIAEAIVEKDKLKATKDLIRNSFSDKYDWLFEFTHICNLEETAK